MTHIGFALSSEENSAPELVRWAQAGEAAGFADVIVSDHFHPWIDAQGQSPFVWSALGGIGTTTGLRVGTGVTCPTMRIHPAIVAQAAATTATMCRGGFFLGVGTGENLNEHVLGDRWPSTDERLAMLAEALEVIRLLWRGGMQSFDGEHYVVDNARLYSLPDRPPPIYMSGFGPTSARLAGRVADGFVNTSPAKELVQEFRKAGGNDKPTLAMTKVCWAADEQTARDHVFRLWPSHGLTGELSQELKVPAHFEQATALVDEDRAVGEMPVGPDPEPYVKLVETFADAGFTDVFLQQVGPDQEGFLSFWQRELAPRLDARRAAA